MALRKVLGFDHIPNVSQSGNATLFNKMIAGLPLVIRQQPSSGKSAVFSADGRLTVGVNSANTYLTWALPSSQYVVGTPKRSWVGFRLANHSHGNATIAYSFVQLTTVAWDSSTGTNRVIAFVHSDLEATLAESLGKEYYLEMCFNWDALTIDRWIDGKQISSIDAVGSGFVAAFRARNIEVLMFAANGANHQKSFRDIYWVDDTEDNTICRRLGAQRVKPLGLTADAGSGWTGTGGATENAVLNTAVNASTPDTPVLTSPASNAPITASLTYPGLASDKVNGIAVFDSAYKTTGTSSVLSAKFSESGQADTPSSPDAVLSNSIVHNTPLLVAEMAPGARAWTKARLESAKLVLTPKN